LASEGDLMVIRAHGEHNSAVLSFRIKLMCCTNPYSLNKVARWDSSQKMDNPVTKIKFESSKSSTQAVE
jgi:hypothetical protein